MNLGYISTEQLPVFSNLMDPQVVEAIKEGEPITAIGIEKDGIACGALTGYLDDGYFQILSFYVAPSFRRQGGATLMLNEIKRLLFQHTSIEKIRIDYTITHEEHETLTAFLAASNFTKENDFGLTLYKFSLGQILNSPLFSSSSKESSNLLAFNKISDNLLVTAQKEQTRKLHHNNVKLHNYAYNHDFMKKVYEGVPFDVTLSLTDSAFKAPEVVPAKETYKQRKERERRDQLAKEHNPGADHYSYDMIQSLQKRRTRLDNTFNNLPENLKEQIVNNHIDNRVLRCFCSGYATNANGEPADFAAEAVKEFDLEFCEDYASGDLEMRTPHLKHILNELLLQEIPPDMFTYPYLKEHAGDVKTICTRFTYFRNVYEDPINKPFFDRQTDKVKELIRIRILDQITPLNQALAAMLGSKAVNTNEDDYIPNDGYTIYHETLKPALKNLSDSLKSKDDLSLEMLIAHLTYERNKCLHFINQQTPQGRLTPEEHQEFLVAQSVASKMADKIKMKLKLHNHYVDINVNIIENLLQNTKLTPEGKAHLNTLKNDPF